MTARELSYELDKRPARVSDTLIYMRRKLNATPRRVHIAGWRDEDESARRYLRPVYGVGDLPDVPRPKGHRAKVGRTVSREYAERLKTSSVFNLGVGPKTAVRRNKSQAAAQDVV